MKFEAWSAKDVEYRAVEAAETVMLSPRAAGPKVFGNSMPTPVRRWEDYGKDPIRYRRLPSPGALDRMVETWGWINALPDEDDRKLLYHWAWTKVRRGRNVSDLADEQGVNPRTIRRHVTRICQRIANTLNQNGVVGLNNGLDRVSEIPSETASQTVASDHLATSPKHPLYHREDGAIPLLRPVTDDDRKRLAKEIERSNKRLRKARARAKA